MEEQFILQSILYGICGGIVRALIGLIKYIFSKDTKADKIRPWYLLFSLLVAAIVGGLFGALDGGDWRIAILSGYAGTDFLEGLYKIRNSTD